MGAMLISLASECFQFAAEDVAGLYIVDIGILGGVLARLPAVAQYSEAIRNGRFGALGEGQVKLSPSITKSPAMVVFLNQQLAILRADDD